jgi:murein L,D-transpeptidase YafK
MTSRSLSSLLIVGAAALILGGCQSETAGNVKSIQPIPAKTLALMKEKGMTRRDPILIRIYKETSELEVWKKKTDGRYGLLKTYEICRFSGALGPKKVEGDGQSPEGFYSVAPGQMNPNSNYYLSFNLGFPNAYDRALGRSGAHLMVHGDCLSKGCYAMTDAQIAEVYAIAREALSAGQPAFQVQALPFRMTAENMARRRNDKNFEFWQNLKEGADHFEVTKLEPKVDTCGHKYVFDAEPKGGGRFDPNAACPAYEVNPLIAMAVNGKERQDTAEFDKLVAAGLQTAEAYIPQNGRERRSLSDPIRKPQPVVMVAEAPKAQTSFALAMADAGNGGDRVPMPVPSPYKTAGNPEKSGGGMFAWMRGGKQAAPSATTPSAASPATTVAMARQTPQPSQPIAASLAPVEKEKPFFKRLWGLGSKDEAPAAAPQSAPKTASAPVPVPAPTPRPAAPKPQASAAPKPAPVPVPEPAPVQTAEPAPQPEPTPQPEPASQPEAAPTRADAAFGAFGAPIVRPGGFHYVFCSYATSSLSTDLGCSRVQLRR